MKLQNFQSLLKSNRPLLFALLLSLISHLLLLSHEFFSLPAIEGNQKIVIVELAKPTPPPQQKTLPTPQQTPPEPSPIQNTEQVSPENPPVAEDTATPTPETPTETNNPETESATVTPENVTQEVTPPQNPPPMPEQPVPPSNDPQPELNNELPIPQPYAFVKTEFEVKRGSDKSAAGKSTITFSINNGAYLLENVTEPVGLVSLFFDQLHEKSEGIISGEGIKPNYYSRKYGNDPDKEQQANFAWSDKVVELVNKKGRKIEPLEIGTQDFLSFMYQFMFSPPLNNMQISMTNGKKLKKYSYSFEGEEVISTKFGELNTLHLVRQGEAEDKTELWLAIDYKYIPVKIRRTEKDGTIIEQTVTRIFTDSTLESDTKLDQPNPQVAH